MPEVRGSQNHRTLGPCALCMATKVARVTEHAGSDTVAAPEDPLGEGQARRPGLARRKRKPGWPCWDVPL